jgi:hypothetical protein
MSPPRCHQRHARVLGIAAAVLAVGEVSFVGIPAASAATTTVTTAATLKTDFQNGGTYDLGADITVATLAVGSGKAVTLTLDGYDFTATGGPNSAGIGVRRRHLAHHRGLEDDGHRHRHRRLPRRRHRREPCQFGRHFAGGTVHATGGGPYG